MEQSGGGSGPPPPPSLSAEFPEPERIPNVNLDFEKASFTDEQMRQDETMAAKLEGERARLEPHPELTYGGPVEQAVHANIENVREAELRQLRARIERHKKRGRGR